ncbi:MAG TPA: glycosyltransferase family 4 protein [Thermoplasmata archaeon]|nr:glycosyltransferase family 4 protein [Thermoplasmata archaeon]
MKLAQLSTRFPPGPGGVERHVHEIAKRLAARGHDVTCYTSDLYQEFPMKRLAPEVPRREQLEGFQVRRLPVWSLPGELHYPFFRGLDGALVADGPQVVHAHTYGTNHAAAARRYARRTGAPFVLTAHYHPPWSIQGGWLRHRIRGFYDQQLAAPIVASAARLIVQSLEEERLLREHGFPLPKVVVIPPGYTPLPPPLEGDRPFARSLELPGPFVLFVGRLASNKGLVALVEGFARLAAHDPSATLVLIGADDGMGPALDARARSHGLGGRVRRIGFVTDERRLAAAFREARVFVLPSEYEAFGLVLLEAMAQGTPVIASRVGGIPEFVPDGTAGRLITPESVPEIADRLLELWDDEATRARLGAYGRDRVVPQFDWDRVTDRLEAVYREVTA